MAVGSHYGHPGAGERLPTVAIVGRPNVGKSTLFNRLVGRRLAIVAAQAGVTRDRQFARGDWNGREFLLADTGGILDRADEALDAGVRRQVMTAIDHADVVLFVTDGRTGLHPVDEHVAELLRRSGRPVVLAVNKLDDLGRALDHHEFHRFGLGDPIPVSALSGQGTGDLLDELVEALPAQADEEEDEIAANIAVIGKPNVGKSSFVNRLLGEDRVLVHDEAGTTRDAIDTYVEFEGEHLRLVDTAGLRRRSRVDDDVEFYSRLRAASAIERADVCILMIDCEKGAGNQDFRIGEQAWDAGCGLVLVANKWDLIEDRGPDIVAQFERDLRERAPYLRWVPIVTVSALSGKRVRRVLEIVREVRQAREKRVATAEVNRVLQELVGRQQPPQGSRGDVRILYGSQVATAPPTFVVWVNRPKDLQDSYVRYLHNGFRAAWGFHGAPVRIRTRARDRS